ncbi:hypothetical protein AAY473_022925 [Plecturocebus cupreus]
MRPSPPAVKLNRLNGSKEKMSRNQQFGDLPHLGKPRQADHLSLGVGDQPGQQDEIPSLPKIQKISWPAEVVWVCADRLLKAGGRATLSLEAENAEQPSATDRLSGGHPVLGSHSSLPDRSQHTAIE